MEFNSALPSQKEGNMTDVKKSVEGKNEETHKNRKSFFDHFFQISDNEIKIGNTKTKNGKNEKIPKVSPNFQNEKNGDNGGVNRGKIAARNFVLAIPAYCVQKLGTAVDVKEPVKKNEEEAYNNIKIEDDLQRSGNEIGTGNNTTNNEKRTSEKHEEVPKVSPYFQNDNGKKEVNGKENGDEIAIETTKSKRKRRLKKHERHGDNEKKVGSESCDGSQENGEGIPIEKIKSKRKKRSKKRKNRRENKENIDPELSCLCCDIGFIEDKLLAHGKTKSKEKKKKVFEDKNGDDDADTSKCILKEYKCQGDNKEKVDPEFFCHGRGIGFVKDKQLADENIKSKEKKKKKAVKDDDAETSKFEVKKMGPEVYENGVHNGTAKMINIKPLEKETKSEPIALPTFVDLTRDELEEDGSEVQINHQPGHESYAVSVVLTSASGDLYENKMKENGNGFESINIEFKKSKFNSQKTVEESVKVRKVFPYFQSDSVKNKAFANKLQENRNDVETSNVKKPLKMKSVVQIKQQGQDSHVDSVVVSVASGESEEVQEIGNETETIKVEFKKMRKQLM